MRLSLSSKKVGNNSNSDSTREKTIFQGRRDLKILHGQAAARWARCESVRGTDQGRVRVLQSDLRTRCATARTALHVSGLQPQLVKLSKAAPRPILGISISLFAYRVAFGGFSKFDSSLFITQCRNSRIRAVKSLLTKAN